MKTNIKEINANTISRAIQTETYFDPEFLFSFEVT